MLNASVAYFVSLDSHKKKFFKYCVGNATLKENTGKFCYFKQQGIDDDADKIKRIRCPAFTLAVLFDGSRGKRNIVANVLSVINLELKVDYPHGRVVGYCDLPGVRKDCPCFEV